MHEQRWPLKIVGIVLVLLSILLFSWKTTPD